MRYVYIHAGNVRLAVTCSSLILSVEKFSDIEIIHRVLYTSRAPFMCVRGFSRARFFQTNRVGDSRELYRGGPGPSAYFDDDVLSP